jgi:hypothetical protein
MPSNLCVVKVRTRVRGSKMFLYCRYAPVLLRCYASDIDRSTSNVWDSVPQVNRNMKEFAKRAATRPAVWQHSARTYAVVTLQKFTHTFLWLGWYLSLSDKFVTWKRVVRILFFVQLNLLFIGSASSFLCDLSSRSEPTDSLLTNININMCRSTVRRY